MTLNVYHSNHLDVLQSIAGHIIQSDPLDHPFDKELFLVQNLGMVNWLNIKLAEQLGIVANSEFLLPTQLLSRVFEALLQAPDQSFNLTKNKLVWPLFSELYTLPNEPVFEPLLTYLHADDPLKKDQKTQKTMALAKQIANLFDQYLVYRPKWINAWENDQLIEGLPAHQLWQQKLWQLLQKNFLQNRHFANIEPLIDRALLDDALVKKLPKRLFIIGLSSLPPLFINMLNKLSPFIDIHLFFHNPSQYYWGDLTHIASSKRINYFSQKAQENTLSPLLSKQLDVLGQMSLFPEEIDAHWLDNMGNPLLASMGTVGRDHLFLLSQYQTQEIEAFSAPNNPQLLGAIQRAIFHLLPINETPKVMIDSDDHSIRIHKTYSPMREVEALYDQLLHLFNSDPTLTPKDIVVMVTDIDLYRPMIDAVFGHTPQNRTIPYTISDYRLNQNEPIADALITLLKLPQSNFAMSTVLNLLHIPEINQHFNIHEEDLPLITHWINEVHIHFGIDQNHLKMLDLPHDEEINTWLWGLQRLLLGYSFADEREFQGIQAYPYIQGLTAQIVGDLTEFIATLIKWQQKLLAPRVLSDWLNIISEIWQDFFIDNPETSSRLHFIHNLWNETIYEGLSIRFTGTFPLEELIKYLIEHFDHERPQQRFMTGNVNFCTFVPMRSIPFKVVCLLGMNQEDFPKTTQFADFDLMQYQPMRGDRTRSNDDRYLFLEAILSAESHLYISYIAYSISDNSEQFASLLVDELLRYIDAIVDPSPLEKQGISLEDHLVISHPMSSLSNRLFTQGTSIQSFQSAWLQKPFFIDDAPYIPNKINDHTLSPKELIDFYKNPAASFCKKHFNLHYYNEQSINDLDDEPFLIEAGLDRYQLHLALLNDLFYNFKDAKNEIATKDSLSADSLTNYAQNTLLIHYKNKGILPKYAFTKIAWDALSAPIIELSHELLQKTSALNKMCFIQLTLANFVIEGELYQRNKDDETVIAYVGDLNLNRQIEGFITHLTHNQNQAVTTTLYGIAQNKIKQLVFEPLTQSDAQKWLLHYLEGYNIGLITPFITPDKLPTAKLISDLLGQLADTDLLNRDFIDTLTDEALIEKIKEAGGGELIESLNEIEDLLVLNDAEMRLFPNISLKHCLYYISFYRDYLLPIIERAK